MGFGSTAKKVQQMVDIAEKLQSRLMDIKDRVEGTQQTVDDTAERVSAIESELGEQRQLLDALAAEQGVEVDFADDDGSTGDAGGEVVDSDTTGRDGNA